MSYCCGKFKTGYKGQRYEVRFMEGAKERVMGWTNREEVAKAMENSVNLHPAWSNPITVDLKPAMETITVKKNTKIKIGGIPYLLANDTIIYGKQQNMDISEGDKVISDKKSFNSECNGD